MYLIMNRHISEMYIRNRHYFNDITYTRWPFFIGWFVLATLLCLVIYVRNISDATNGVTRATLVALLLVFVTALNCWFNDVDREAQIDNRYGRKLRAALVCGFTLFLVSETMLFGGFFWAFFDRVYNPGYMNSMCMPTGMERIDYWRWPFVGTVVLITSGYYANRTYYELRAGAITEVYSWGALVLLLAVSFLAIQLLEYNGLNLTMSDNVYGSFFYLLTGFHGFHVLVGFLFLCEQIGRCRPDSKRHTKEHWDKWYIRTYKTCRPSMTQNRYRHLGLAFAVVYWHFVDIIWIFLYINVYIFSMDNLREGLEVVIRCLPADFANMHTYMRSFDFTLLTLERLAGFAVNAYSSYWYTAG
jgi:heme/copper-type cytochrome/quinol oxidase subunit 3